LLTLSACAANNVNYVPKKSTALDALLKPVELPMIQPSMTNNDLAELIVLDEKAIEQCNRQLNAIDKILNRKN